MFRQQKQFIKLQRCFRVLIAFSFALSLFLPMAQVVYVEAQASRPIFFPVMGPSRFSNDYYTPRPAYPSGIHQATDIMATKGEPLVAAVSGTIEYVISPEASWGYSIGITDSEGYKYIYIHINNDTPGTNDNRGTEMNAYAPDMKRNNKVEAGQLIGFNGDSGNSNGVAHLHFEMEAPDGTPMNPYYSLLNAPRVSTPSLYPPQKNETLPYWVEFRGGLSLAMGDFNGDKISETVTGAGVGGGPHVKTYSESNGFLGEFFAYDPRFRGGIDVATGDLNGDGTDEIITGPGPGGGPWVRIFDTQAKLLSEFAAYTPDFLGGIRVSSGDLNGDGTDEIITGPGPGGGPWVRVFDAQAKLLSEFAAYDPGFIGGIDVASADTAGTTVDEIITGPGPGGGPWVRVFDAQAKSVVDIQVYDQLFTGGVKVSAGNVKSNSPKSEIMSIPWEYGESRVRLMTNTGANIIDYTYLESWWKGHYDVAAGNGESRLGTGINRRASMRDGPE